MIIAVAWPATHNVAADRGRDRGYEDTKGKSKPEAESPAPGLCSCTHTFHMFPHIVCCVDLHAALRCSGDEKTSYPCNSCHRASSRDGGRLVWIGIGERRIGGRSPIDGCGGVLCRLCRNFPGTRIAGGAVRSCRWICHTEAGETRAPSRGLFLPIPCGCLHAHRRRRRPGAVRVGALQHRG